MSSSQAHCVKAIEYNGMLIVFKNNVPVDQAWFIAKNVRTKNALAMSCIWKNMKDLGCDYDESIKSILNDNYISDLKVSSCTGPTNS
jgi:hypothetical protein